MVFDWFKGRESTHYYCPECGEELYEWEEDFCEEGEILLVDWLCIFCFGCGCQLYAN